MPENGNSTRNLLENYEFFEYYDDYECFIQLMKEIPLLPIFGDFNTNEKRDDVSLLFLLILPRLPSFLIALVL